MASPALSAEKRPSSLERAAKRFVEDIRKDLAEDRLVWPSVPSGVVRIRQVMESPEVSAEAITRAVATDPALSTKLVKVANSVYFGAMAPCRDLRSAVVRLGSSALEHVVMLFVVAQVFSVGKRRQIQPHLRRLWQHSTLVGALAETLATAAPHLERDVALLGGLTHDIGALPVMVRAEQVPPLIANRRLLDPLIDRLHCEIGRAMLHAWRFPAEVIAAAAEHEHLERDAGQRADYVDVVMVANLASRLGTEHRHGRGEWVDIPAVRKLGLDRKGLRELVLASREKEKLLQDL